ncbi:MAG: sugar ABC transporter ATP-binding protein, partial [bacterium]|nr:sugar ABC transporter ATP-binding protein [bacterium]
MTPSSGKFEPDSREAVLRAECVTKVYPGTVALDRVSFAVRRGKVNVLIGENGAGKSTLVKILAGVEQATSGRLLMDGDEVRFPTTREATAAGIGMIHQELNLCGNLSVAENVFLGRERTRGLVVDVAEQQRQTRELLARLEQQIDPKARVDDLRLGEQQIVEIAKALARDAKVLIMDEPTSALSESEVRALFRLMRELTTQGVSIVYISHRLEELMEIGDFVTVLRDGQRVAEAAMEEVDLAWIVEQMVGGKLESVFHGAEHQAGKEMLRAVIGDVSLAVRAGEIVGIYGLMGAGRTELFETLIGVRETPGSVELDGHRLDHLPAAERIRRGLVLVPEDRQAAGLVQPLSVSDNITLASLRGLTSTGHNTEVARLIAELSIKAGRASDPVTSLSGGNQQKVVVAKCLLTEPKVLWRDEPARGLDVGAKAEMCGIMNRLASDGMANVVGSSELEEVLALADRVVVMWRGSVTGESP